MRIVKISFGAINSVVEFKEGSQAGPALATFFEFNYTFNLTDFLQC